MDKKRREPDDSDIGIEHAAGAETAAEGGALDASDMEVLVQGGEVTLAGFVWTKADKRRAEDIADAVPGVTHVQNNLRVKRGAM